MGLCGSKSDLKLEEVPITEKPPAESHAAAENPAAETAVGTTAGTAAAEMAPVHGGGGVGIADDVGEVAELADEV